MPVRLTATPVSTNKTAATDRHRAGSSAGRGRQAILEPLEGRALFSAVGFLPAVQVPAGSGPMSIAEADFNGDGRPDVVTANFGGSSISVELGQLPGFPPGPCVNTSLPFHPIAVAAGDFNGDGKADVVVIAQASTFNSAGLQVVTNQAYFLAGTGGGHFSAPVPLPTGLAPLAMPTALAVGDFNHDGISDLAVYDAAGGTVSLFDGSTMGLLPAVRYMANAPGGARLVTGYFAGDGSVDIATITEDGTVHVLFNSGDGALLPAVDVATNLAHTGAVTVGDFNGDGRSDIVVATSDDTVHTFLSSGTPDSFQLLPAGASLYSAPISSITTADLDGDGKLDLVVGGPTMIGYQIGNGDGTFARPMMLKTATGPATPNSLVAGDFNGDGSVDIADADLRSSTIDFYFSHFAAISAVGRNFTGYTGVALTNLSVASFTDLAGNLGPAGYSASIDWGDGTVTQGTIVAGPSNTLFVQGSHTYSTANTFTLHITITPLSSGPAIAVTDSALISALRNVLTGRI